MKNTSRSHRFKPTKPVLLALLICVLVGTTAVALEKTHVIDLVKDSSSDESASDTSGPTEEQKAEQAKVDAQNKQAYLDSVAKSDGSSSDATTPSAPDSFKLSASQSGSSVTVLTQIQNVSEGSCKLTVTNGSSSTSQTAQIIYAPQFSSCAGFSVPVSSVGTGNWTISIVVTPTGGTALTQTTNLEVN